MRLLSISLGLAAMLASGSLVHWLGQGQGQELRQGQGQELRQGLGSGTGCKQTDSIRTELQGEFHEEPIIQVTLPDGSYLELWINRPGQTWTLLRVTTDHKWSCPVAFGVGVAALPGI